jgi:dinuclear metal center YbgI/SA1388 family protein
MASLQTIIDHCDELLQVDGFDDYCPNGLQVEAGQEVQRVVTGVTASLALIEEAAAWRADLLLVHHGYFWRGEPQPLTGLKGRRIATLLRNGVSLLAYHLPLDAHAEFGNNRQLGERLGAMHDAGPLGEGSLVWRGTLERPLGADELAARIAVALERVPLHIDVDVAPIERLAWCSGAAQGFIEQAARGGAQAYVSGEISEQTPHLARELGIHYFAAGHHATERYGVRALGEHLAGRFGLSHHYVEIPNPA